MDAIFGFAQGAIWVLVALAVLVVLAIYAKLRYKAANANQVLVISGGKKGLKTRVAGGAFVSPLHKFQFFSLETMTVRSNDQETQSSTLVPVIVKWTAQLRADTETPGALDKAIQGFISYANDEAIANSLQQTLDGEVRAVIATMTPEAVVREKEAFSTQVTSGVQDRMTELGFRLVSLNIAEVNDRHNHYTNLAAEDREEKRRAAEKLTAEANKDVSVAKAVATQVAQSAQLDSDLLVAEKQREVTIRKASIKSETDVAETDAQYASQLRAQERDKELATRKGEVKVIEVRQEQAAAEARRQVDLTEAETIKQRQAVEAQAAKEQAEIAANAEARKAEIAAEAAAKVAQRRAAGEADATVAKAQGEADAIKRTTEAKAEQVRQTGLAQAEVTRANGEAEAAAILAKGTAEAEAQRKMAEALAANDGANLRVTLAEIERDTRVTIYTEIGKVMGTIGEKATFIDMGGRGNSGDGDLLTNILGSVPELLKRLDVKSEALQGQPFGKSMSSVASSFSSNSKDASAEPAMASTGAKVHAKEQDQAADTDNDQ